MSRLAKFWVLDGRDKLLLCEAAFWLVLAQLAILTVPYRHIDGVMRRWWRGEDSCDVGSPDLIRRVRSAVTRAARALPWRCECLCRSMATYVMLRRRGIPAALVAGVKVEEDASLHAHAWVETSNRDLGGDIKNAAFTPVLMIGEQRIDC